MPRVYLSVSLWRYNWITYFISCSKIVVVASQNILLNSLLTEKASAFAYKVHRINDLSSIVLLGIEFCITSFIDFTEFSYFAASTSDARATNCAASSVSSLTNLPRTLDLRKHSVELARRRLFSLSADSISASALISLSLSLSRCLSFLRASVSSCSPFLRAA